MSASRAPSRAPDALLERSRTQSRDGIVPSPADFSADVPLTRRLVLKTVLWGESPPVLPGDTPREVSMRLRDLASLRVALWATMLLAPGHTLIFGLLTPEPPLLKLIAVALVVRAAQWCALVALSTAAGIFPSYCRRRTE